MDRAIVYKRGLKRTETNYKIATTECMKILFNEKGVPKPSHEMRNLIARFKYYDASVRIIKDSRDLNKNGSVFLENASYILANFGMTRSGRFKDPGERREILLECWCIVGESIIKIHSFALNGGYERDRFLLEIDPLLA